MLCSSARGGRRVRSVAGVLGDELRMMRGITVQHPAQLLGGQRRFVARKISADELRAATTAQRRRGVLRLAGRFDLQWGTAQAWIAEGIVEQCERRGRAGRRARLQRSGGTALVGTAWCRVQRAVPSRAHVVERASCGRQASVGDKQAWFVSSYEEWTQQQFEHVCAARIA